MQLFNVAMVTAANFFTCCCKCVYHVSALSGGEGWHSGTSNRVKLSWRTSNYCQICWIIGNKITCSFFFWGGGGLQEDTRSASVQGSSAGGSSRSEDPRTVACALLEIGVMCLIHLRYKHVHVATGLHCRVVPSVVHYSSTMEGATVAEGQLEDGNGVQKTDRDGNTLTTGNSLRVHSCRSIPAII